LPDPHPTSDAANKTERGRTHTEFVMKRDLTLSASTISKFLSDDRGIITRRLLIQLEFISLSSVEGEIEGTSRALQWTRC
jgi:hypothetical protein